MRVFTTKIELIIDTTVCAWVFTTRKKTELKIGHSRNSENFTIHDNNTLWMYVLMHV